jgi:hypothetical protein
MSFSKLKKMHVIIIGSVLFVIAGVGVFFLQVKPQMDAYKVAKAKYEKESVKGNEQSKQAAIRQQELATLALNQAQALLDVQMRRRMPYLNFSRRDIGMLALWKEQIKVMGPLLENFARDGNVRVLQAGFKIAAPPANPNDALFTQDVLVFPLGQVTVSGDFKRVMNNIRRWNNCRRLVMVGPPRLGGESPQLMVSYDVTCYVFPAAKASMESTIDMAGAGTGTPGVPTPAHRGGDSGRGHRRGGVRRLVDVHQEAGAADRHIGSGAGGDGFARFYCRRDAARRACGARWYGAGDYDAHVHARRDWSAQCSGHSYRRSRTSCFRCAHAWNSGRIDYAYGTFLLSRFSGISERRVMAQQPRFNSLHVEWLGYCWATVSTQS